MYKVIKGFTSEKISASKGKVIDIKDKKLVNNLIDAGVIEPFSNKELSSVEKDNEITFLKSEVTRLEQEKNVLIQEKEKLQEALNEQLENTTEKEKENDDNLENEDLESNKNSNKEDESKDGEIVADSKKDKKE